MTSPDNAQRPEPHPKEPEKGKFYAMKPIFDNYFTGLVFENEQQLLTPPRMIIRPEGGGFPPLRETPRFRHDPKEGKGPRDWQASFSGYWLISERLKKVFEEVDPEGFVFAACDYFHADGSHGPQYYLCDVIRTLDALDEEASIMKPPIFEEDYDTGEMVKIYDFSGYPTKLAFREETVGNAHVFRTPYRSQVFCDRVLRDAIRAAGKTSEGRIRGIALADVADP